MANELILYSTEDGLAQLTLRQMQGQIWLTQLEMAELYQTSKQNIGKHVQAVIADGKDYLTQLYALPMIIAVGYRVRSTRGTQFRKWATRAFAIRRLEAVHRQIHGFQ